MHSLHCYVGPEHDGDDLAHLLHPRVEDGWLTALVHDAAGAMVVPRQDDSEVRDPLAIQWAGADSDVSIPCEPVDPDDRVETTLHIRVLLPDGAPAPKAGVKGCSAMGQTDAQGHTTVVHRALRTPQDDVCWIHAEALELVPGEGRFAIVSTREGSARVEGLQRGGTREVVIDLSQPMDRSDPLSLDDKLTLHLGQLAHTTDQLARLQSGPPPSSPEALQVSALERARLERQERMLREQIETVEMDLDITEGRADEIDRILLLEQQALGQIEHRRAQGLEPTEFDETYLELLRGHRERLIDGTHPPVEPE